MTTLLRILVPVSPLLLLTGLDLSVGQEKDADLYFTSQVQPILVRHCQKCHTGEKKKAGLDVGGVGSILRGAHSGPVVVPGKSAQSLLIHVLSPKADPHMPPRGQVPDEETAVLKKWIDGLKPTAAVSGKVITDKDRDHWAFRPLDVQPPPVPSSVPVRTTIDAFIIAKLHAAGLQPAPEASRQELVRRAYFDLIGLPPSPEELEKSLADPSPDWYEQLLDRLLASPHYGERWARHWLDLARYAESNGIGEDRERPNAWRYRDYVIQSFNEDKPYGRFIREQLAGDELDHPAVHTPLNLLIATGFCRHAPTVDVIRAQDAEKYRIEEMDDVISTTASVFLGLTLGCARCHDHKYDPITQVDYYRFLAIFNSSTKKDLPLGPDSVAAGDEKKPPVAGQVRTVNQQAAKGAAIMAITDIGAVPRKTHLLWRGDIRNPGPEVQPGVPEVLTRQPLEFPKPAAGSTSTGRRRILADWLASPDNGLAWRVIANRLWQYHFGRGIVESSSNFGYGGDRPTHPELLDWLAGELIRHDGRFKPIHKVIMMSSVYRQSARQDSRGFQVDPDNRLLWRMNRRRLEAEPIRDAVLAVAGTLNPVMGGPSIKPRIHPTILAGNQMTKWPTVAREGPEHWRRSVYICVRRSLQMPMLELFDAPTPTQTCHRRAESTVPTQALMMMNGDFLNEQAAFFAGRVQREAGTDPGRQIERAFVLALSRLPGSDERRMCLDFLQRQSLTDLCHVLLSCNEFVYVN